MDAAHGLRGALVSLAEQLGLESVPCSDHIPAAWAGGEAIPGPGVRTTETRLLSPLK